MKRVCVSVCLTLLLTGCTEKIKPKFALMRGDVTSQGALPVIEPDAFEKIDLIATLDPMEGGDGELPEPNWWTRFWNSGWFVSKSDWELDRERKKIQRAFSNFYSNPSYQPLETRRNAVQERILAASNQRCDDFKHRLRQLEAEGNFFLGVVTTALGGLGAIFTPATTARALAGAAGIASGIRAEFQEDFFQSLTTHVITAGIDTKRQELYEAIQKRQEESIVKYPVEAAIKDAVSYHGTCTTISGLQTASESIKQATDPGLKRMNQILKAAQIAKKFDVGNEGVYVADARSNIGIRPLAEVGTDIMTLSPVQILNRSIWEVQEKSDRVLRQVNAKLLIKDLDDAAKRDLKTSGDQLIGENGIYTLVINDLKTKEAEAKRIAGALEKYFKSESTDGLDDYELKMELAKLQAEIAVFKQSVDQRLDKLEMDSRDPESKIRSTYSKRLIQH